MKRVVLLIAGVIAASTSVLAQGPADFDTALMPAPPRLRDGATVIKWKPDYTYETLRKGANRLVCFDVSGMPGQMAFSVECTSVANLPRVAQNLRFEAEPDRAKRQAAFDAAEKDGTRVKPEFGSAWIRIRGDSREHHFQTHTTIAVPGATTASLGFPEDDKQGGIWIMNAGTSTAHLMIPGQ